MSRASRAKGSQIERQIVAPHAALGIKAERVPLSGAARYQGNGADLDIYAFGADAAPFVGEVKARGNGEGFRETGNAGSARTTSCFLRRDRAEPIVVPPWRIWARLLGATARKPLPAPPVSLLQAGHDGNRCDPSHPMRGRLRAPWWQMTARLTLYTESGPVAAVALAPRRAGRASRAS